MPRPSSLDRSDSLSSRASATATRGNNSAATSGASGWVLVFLAVIISAVANSNAGANATTRTWFALGRNRILPGVLARTHPRWQSPYVAVLVQFVLALAVALPLGYIYDPVTAFSLVATMVTAVIILIYIALNLACIGFYLRERRSEFNVVRHLVLPVLGVLAFIPAIMAALGIGEGLFPFITAAAVPAQPGRAAGGRMAGTRAAVPALPDRHWSGRQGHVP